MSEDAPREVQSDQPFILRVWHGAEGVLSQWALFGVFIVVCLAIAFFISGRTSTHVETNEVSEEQSDTSRAGILRAVSELGERDLRNESEKLEVLEELSETAEKSNLTDAEKLELLKDLKQI